MKSLNEGIEKNVLKKVYKNNSLKVEQGPRDPGLWDSETCDPGPPSKFKS